MKRTMKKLVLLTMAFALTLGINSLYAEQGLSRDRHKMGPGGNGDGPWMMIDRELLDQVGLTADQKTKVDALNSEHQKTVIKQQADMKILRVDLRTEMDKDTIDMTKIGELADKISKGQAELTKMRIMHAAQVESIMTKEQRTKLEQLRTERRQTMMERSKNKSGRARPMKEKE
jgi:Spy/CpxP family protein refolding chaperone